MPTRLLRDWTDSEKFDGISPEAERLFIRLIMKADDYGRFHANPKLMRAACFPLAEDLRANTVASWLTELSDRHLVFCYTSGTGKYLAIPNFRQRLKQSVPKFPPLPGKPGNWLPDDGTCQQPPAASGTFPELPGGSGKFPSDAYAETDTDAESETDKETDKHRHTYRAGARGAATTLPGAESDPGTPTTPEIPTLDQVKAFAALPTSAVPPEVADDFWHANQACGWLDHKSRPVADWRAALVMFQRYRKTPSGRPGGGPRGAPDFRSTPAEPVGLQLPTPNHLPVPRTKPLVF